MNSIQRVKCYLPFSTNMMKRNMAYRGAFFIALLSRLMTVFVTYYLWKAIFTSSTTEYIQGFSFTEMTTYIIINFLTGIMSGIGGRISMIIASDVSDGSIAMQLIKPIQYRGIKLAEEVGNFCGNFITQILPFAILFIIIGFIPLTTLPNVILYMISVILGFLCMFWFGFCFGLFSFYTMYFFGMNMAMTVLIEFFSGSLIPLSFFPEKIELLFRFLPFASANYIPNMIFLGKLQGTDIRNALGLQLFWIIIFYLLGRLVWKLAINRLTILGG